MLTHLQGLLPQEGTDSLCQGIHCAMHARANMGLS